MANVRIYFLLFLCSSLYFVTSEQMGRPCQLGFYEQGVCTHRNSCPGIEYVRDSGSCGYRGRRSLVCCPVGNNGYGVNEPESMYGGRDFYGRPYRPRRGQENKVTPNEPFPGRSKEEQKQSISDEKCATYNVNVKSDNHSPIIFFPAVVGGQDTIEKEFPHMAALGFGKKGEEQWLCGGSLISDQYVLTAAHCLFSQQLGDLNWVRLGDLNIKNTEDDAAVQNFAITSRIRHPDYKPPSQYHDIALVKLNQPAVFNDHVKPICLYTSKELKGSVPVATGWGRTQYGGETSDHLKKVDLNFYSIEDCQSTYASISKKRLPNGIVDETQICAGGLNEEKDTCQGDSGGPLQVEHTQYEKMYHLVGITSFGIACGIANSPGVYTRVSYYVPWIEKIVWGN